MSHAARRNFIVSLICITLAITAVYWYVPQRAAGADVSPGNLWGWGANSGGQLGIGRASNQVAPPVGVRDKNNPSGFLTNIINAALGGSFSLALNADHTVSAMGSDGAGQLGRAVRKGHPEYKTQSNFPIKVKDAAGNDLGNVQAVSAGTAHSLAIKADGTLWAWGNNNEGQLGIGGSIGETDVPTQVAVSTQQGEFSVQAISAGSYFSLALTKDKKVWAWGRNNFGEVGNNSTSKRFTPVLVSGIDDVKAIAAGQDHSLALKDDDTVWAWGKNTSGQLGDINTTTDRRLTPAPVPGLDNVRAIAAGHNHNLALKNDGTVWAWGNNTSGQLGDSLQIPRATPVQVPGLSDIVAIAAGQRHSLALKSDGTIWAWGNNGAGQLGVGGLFDESLTPLQVPNIAGVTAIAASANQSMAIKPYNVTGRFIKSGSHVSNEFTVAVKDAQNNINVRTTDFQGYYALGEVVGGGSYEIVPTNTAYDYSPLNGAVSNLSGHVRIDFNATPNSSQLNIRGVVKDRNEQPLTGVTVNLSYEGKTETIQTDTFGQYSFVKPQNTTYTVSPSDVENYDFEPRSSPSIVSLEPNETFDFVGVMVKFSDDPELPLDQNIVWAWGSNGSGKLGYQTQDGESAVPTQVNSLAGIKAVGGIGGADAHSVALARNGTVFAWGNNQFGQLGNGALINAPTSNTPVPVTGLGDVISVATGFRHNLVLTSSNQVAAWGVNGSGSIGDGTSINRRTPVFIGLDNVKAISAGHHSLALKNDGTVWAWGFNGHDALGNPNYPWSNFSNVKTPQQVPELTDVAEIAAGYHHSLVRKNDGTVWAWGRNDAGQLGNGQISPKGRNHGISKPAPVTGLSGVTAIAAGAGCEELDDIPCTGYGHSLALKNDGTVWAWGDNTSGQLGDKAQTARATPAQVPGLGGGKVVAIAAGQRHSLALKDDGTVWAWGDNTFGQLGTGDTASNDAPEEVTNLTGVLSIAAGRFHNLATVETREISGTVRLASGEGVPEISVTLSGPTTVVARTGGDGSYSFRNLSLHGDYRVTPSNANYTFSPESPEFLNLSGNQTAVDFTATPGQSSESLSLSNSDVIQGLLTQSKPVFDKKVKAEFLGLNQVEITPQQDATGEHYGGFVSTKAVDLENKTIRVRLDQVASGNSETIFSVGSDKNTWFRFVVKEGAGAAAAAAATNKGDTTTSAEPPSLSKIIQLQQLAGANQTPTIVQEMPLADIKELAISATASEVVFSTGDANNNWTARAAVAKPTTPNGAPIPVAAEFSAGTSAPVAQPGKAMFSNLNVNVEPPGSSILSTIQLSADSISVNKDQKSSVAVMVTRTGATSSAAAVDYTTSDNYPADQNCAADTGTGQASARCDYLTTLGTLQFAPGEVTKEVTIPLIDNQHPRGDLAFNFTLSNVVGAGQGRASETVTILDEVGPGPNPIDTIPYFIRMNYLDFLSREPEPDGFENWKRVLENCAPDDTTCDRIAVSSSFFRSEEFGVKGYFVYRYYTVTLGKRPTYAEIIPDMARVTGQTGPERIAKQNAFADAWVERPEYKTLNPDSLSHQDYVNGLEQRAGVTLGNKAQYVADLNNGVKTRAQVLREIVESPEVLSRFKNEAFVYMQYIGYLRRNPEEPGFSKWLGVLNANPDDFRTMINGFLNSVEYRNRFGKP